VEKLRKEDVPDVVGGGKYRPPSPDSDFEPPTPLVLGVQEVTENRDSRIPHWSVSEAGDENSLRRNDRPQQQVPSTVTKGLNRPLKGAVTHVRGAISISTSSLKGATAGKAPLKRPDMSRHDTLASTIASSYSPSNTPAPPPKRQALSQQKSFKAFTEERQRKTKSQGTGEDVTSAAQMASASRSRMSKHAPNESISATLPPRAKSPIPDPPARVMSPPLQADLFFSPTSSPTKHSRPKPQTNLQTQVKRNPSQATTATTNRSHISMGRRGAEAAAKVDEILKESVRVSRCGATEEPYWFRCQVGWWRSSQSLLQSGRGRLVWRSRGRD